MNFED